ncbi:hypothetical protein BDL97_15G076800 [Sphagnum fallax]|nr:hypothetical protein BDL97_15G076800 [Sphagnum fallax]
MLSGYVIRTSTYLLLCFLSLLEGWSYLVERFDHGSNYLYLNMWFSWSRDLIEVQDYLAKGVIPFWMMGVS